MPSASSSPARPARRLSSASGTAAISSAAAAASSSGQLVSPSTAAAIATPAQISSWRDDDDTAGDADDALAVRVTSRVSAPLVATSGTPPEAPASNSSTPATRTRNIAASKRARGSVSNTSSPVVKRRVSVQRPMLSPVVLTRTSSSGGESEGKAAESSGETQVAAISRKPSQTTLSFSASSTALGTASVAGPSATAATAATTTTAAANTLAPPANTNVNVIRSRDRPSAGVSSHTTAKAARESNLSSSLTSYMQNQLSLLSKRGHVREVLKMLEMREATLMASQDERQASSAIQSGVQAATNTMSATATGSGAPSRPEPSQANSYDAFMASLLEHEQAHTLQPLHQMTDEQRLFHQQQQQQTSVSARPPPAEADADSPRTTDNAPRRGAHHHRVSTAGMIYAPLAKSRPTLVDAANAEQSQSASSFASAAAAAAVHFPTGSSNPFLPALPAVKLYLPSENYLNPTGPVRDALTHRAQNQYTLLATQHKFVRAREEKEDALLRHASVGGGNSWDSPYQSMSLSDDARDAFGRRMLAGLASPKEQAARFATLALTGGDPVPHATALHSLTQAYTSRRHRDYRPYVSGASVPAAERNAVLDYDVLRRRDKGQWSRVLRLAREEANAADRTLSGSQSARVVSNTVTAHAGAYLSSTGSLAPSARPFMPEPPSQLACVNPPRPPLSMHRNLHALAYRINNAVSATNAANANANASAAHHTASLSAGGRGAKQRHKASASLNSVPSGSQSARAAAHTHTRSVGGSVSVGAAASPHPLPSQPLASNIYTTGGFVASDFGDGAFLDEDEVAYDSAATMAADDASGPGRYGSYSATGGFQRVSALTHPFGGGSGGTVNGAFVNTRTRDEEALARWKQSLQAGSAHEPRTTHRASESGDGSSSKSDLAVAPVASLASLLDFTDRNGSTPLFHSAWEGFTPIIALLCEYGADVNVRNVRRHTAMDMAVERSHVDVVRILMRYGCDATEVEARAARHRCHARLGQTYATWLKRMRAGRFLSPEGGGGGGGGADSPEPGSTGTSAPLPTDPETQYYLPLHVSLQATDREILRHFAHTVFRAPPTTSADHNAVEAIDTPRVLRLTREARLARRRKLAADRAESNRLRKKYPQSRGQRAAAAAAAAESNAATGGVEEEEEARRFDETRSILSHLTTIRESRVRANPAPTDSGRTASNAAAVEDDDDLDAYESDLTSLRAELARQRRFYETQAHAIRRRRAEKESNYSSFDAWADELDLAQAVLLGDLPTVERLLTTHPEHSAMRIHGCTLLYHAAYHGFYGIARALLAASVEHRLDVMLEAAAVRAVDLIVPDDSDVVRGAQRANKMDAQDDDPSHPYYDPDRHLDGTERPPEERPVYFFAADGVAASAAGAWGPTAPRTLDVNFLCVDELKTREESASDATIRKQMESRAQNRDLRRRLANKRQEAAQAREDEKTRKRQLGLSDSDEDTTSDDEDEDEDGNGDGEAVADGKKRTRFALVASPNPASRSLDPSPEPTTTQPKKKTRSKKKSHHPYVESSRARRQREQDELIDGVSNPLQFQLWHQWHVKPRAWNKALRARQLQATNAARDIDDEETAALLRLQRAEDAAAAAADAEDDDAEDASPVRYETAIYIAIKRKHYRLALLLQSFGAISPYKQSDLLLLCDIQLRARRLMAAIRCGNHAAIARMLEASASTVSGVSVLPQLLQYQDTNGANPLLLTTQRNDLRGMELMKHATVESGGGEGGAGEGTFAKMLSSVKDRLGYSAIENSMLNAAATTSADGAPNPNGAAGGTQQQQTDMTSYLLNQSGLTLATSSVLDLILNKQSEESGALHYSINYEGVEKLRAILLNSVSFASGSVANLHRKPPKQVIDFVELDARLVANPFHLRVEHVTELRDLLRTIEEVHSLAREKRATGRKGEGSASSSRRGTAVEYPWSTGGAGEMEVVHEGDEPYASDAHGSDSPAANFFDQEVDDEETMASEAVDLQAQLAAVEEEEQEKAARKEAHRRNLEELKASLLEDDSSDEEDQEPPTPAPNEVGAALTSLLGGHHGSDSDSDNEHVPNTATRHSAVAVANSDSSDQEENADGAAAIEEGDEEVDARASPDSDAPSRASIRIAVPFTVPAAALGVISPLPNRPGLSSRRTRPPVIDMEYPADASTSLAPPPVILPDLLPSELKAQLVWMLDDIESPELMDAMYTLASGGFGSSSGAATPPPFANNDHAVAELVRQTSSRLSQRSTSDQPAEIDATPLRWSHVLRSNPHLAQLVGVDYPIDPSRPVTLEEIAARSADGKLPTFSTTASSAASSLAPSVAPSVAPSAAPSRRNSAHDKTAAAAAGALAAQMTLSRRSSGESVAGAGESDDELRVVPAVSYASRPPLAPTTASTKPPPHPTRMPAKVAPTAAVTPTPREPPLPHERPDPPSRTVTLASWLEAFQRLAREAGVPAVRALLDIFEATAIRVREEARRRELRRRRAAERVVRDTPVSARASPFGRPRTVSAISSRREAAVAAVRQARVLSGDVDLSDVDTRQAGLGVTDFLPASSSRTHTPATTTTTVATAQSDESSATMPHSTTSSIFAFVPHLDPRVAPDAIELTEAAAAAALRATQKSQKSVRWRGGGGGNVPSGVAGSGSASTSGGVTPRMQDDATGLAGAPAAISLREQLRAQLARTPDDTTRPRT